MSISANGGSRLGARASELAEATKDITYARDAKGHPVGARGRLEEMLAAGKCTCSGCYFGEKCRRGERVAGDEDDKSRLLLPVTE